MKKPISRNKLTKEIEKAFPKVWLKTTEEFGTSKGGLWTGEGSVIEGSFTWEEGTEWAGQVEKFSTAVFNFYSYDVDPKEETWIMGVHKDFHKFLEDRGWFAEAQDGGTYMIWKA